MIDYQQDQARWEWMDQEEERWHAENIRLSATRNELVAVKPVLDRMLSDFDSMFMNEGE